VYLMEKSFHYLRVSDVNIFIFYCDAHNEGVVIELKELCNNVSWKCMCSAIILDKTCDMSTLLNAQIKVSGMLVDTFNGKDRYCDKEILGFAFAKCNLFLKSKFRSIGTTS
jgi:hypothetical protein